MIWVFPGEPELLLIYNEVVLPVMDLQRFVTFAVDTPVHVPRKDFLSF